MSGSLGQRVRAARMRFHWSARHLCYIRMTSEGANLRIELAPEGLVPNERRDGVQHVIWWEGPTRGADVLDLCEALRPYEGKGVTCPEVFWVDEYGCRIGGRDAQAKVEQGAAGAARPDSRAGLPSVEVVGAGLPDVPRDTPTEER